MRYDESDFPVSFDFSEEIFKPLKFLAWIVSVAPKIVVEDVTRLGVYCNDIHIAVYGAVTEFELLSVVSSLSINFLGISVEILLPKLKVESQNRVWLFEVLGVDYLEIMVPFKGVY